MTVHDFSSTDNTVNIQWYNDEMVVIDSDTFYLFQRKIPDNKEFWEVIIRWIKKMILLKSQGKIVKT